MGKSVDESEVINETYNTILKSLTPIYKMTALQALEDSKYRIHMAIKEARLSRSERSTSVLAAYAAASVKLSGLPKKLNPIIRSLMDSIKSEEILLLQSRTANAVAHLIFELNKAGKYGAADKMIKNLCAFLCVDTS